MNRPSLLPLCALLVVAAAPALAQEGAPAKKIAVLPFAALSGDVPNRAGAKAASMLANELKNIEALQLVEVKRAAAADPFQEALEGARKLVSEAKEQRAKRKFRLAEETLQKALALYKSGAPGLADIGELCDAFALLSAVQYNTGRDEEGHKSLLTALTLAPTRELPLAKTSALFSRVVEEARKGVVSGPRGVLLVESTPPGAQVSIDGVALGGTPLQVKDVPAGTHVWRVSLPSGEATGGYVEVAGGKTAKVAGQTAAKDAESKVLATLSQNKLDPELVAALKELAAGAEAELVLFGALSKDGKGLALDAFLLGAATGEVRRLPKSRFDAELLSAGMEFYAVAGQLAANGLKVGEPARVPGTVASGPLPSGVKVAEAQYGAPAGKEETIDEPVKDEGPRTPVVPKVRRPLLKK